MADATEDDIASDVPWTLYISSRGVTRLQSKPYAEKYGEGLFQMLPNAIERWLSSK